MSVIEFKPGVGELLEGCGCLICGETVYTGCRTCKGTGHFTANDRALGLVPCDVCWQPVDPDADACRHCG